MTSSAPTDPTPLPATARVRHWPVLLTMAGGALLSLSAAALVRTWEIERVSREFEWRAESRARTIEQMLRSYEESLYAVRDVFHAAESVTAQTFKQAASAQLDRHPGLVTLEWLPLVRNEERAATERAMKETQPTWFIRDRTDAPGPSGPRAEYLPVMYCEPLAGREATLGTDQFLGNYQRAIQRAMETGMPSATRRVPMEGEADDPFAISILIPVYLPSPERETFARTRTQIRGFVRGVFSLRKLALHSALTQEGQSVELVLMDHTPAGTDPYLFHLLGTKFGTPPPAGSRGFRAWAARGLSNHLRRARVGAAHATRSGVAGETAHVLPRRILRRGPVRHGAAGVAAAPAPAASGGNRAAGSHAHGAVAADGGAVARGRAEAARGGADERGDGGAAAAGDGGRAGRDMGMGSPHGDVHAEPAALRNPRHRGGGKPRTVCEV